MPILYGVPLIITGVLADRRSIILMLSGTVLLTWIGAALSPGEVVREVLAGRTLVTGLLLTTGWFLFRQKSSAEKLAQVHQANEVSERRQRLLADTAALLLQSVSPRTVTHEICQRVMAELDCELCFNYLLDSPTQRLHLNVCFGVPEEERAHIAWLNLGEAVCGAVALKGQAIVAEHLAQTHDEATQLVRSYGAAAYACHPLIVQDRVVGTLSFGTRTKASFPDDELALMKAVADQVALLLQRVRSEDTVRASEEQLRLFIRQAPAAIAMFDREMRYLAASDRWYTDYGLEGDVIGRSHYDVFPEIPDRWKAIHRRGLAGEVVRDDDDPVTRADGSIQWVQWEVRPWFREGDIKGITIMTEDVTTRVRAVQSLVDNEAKLRHVLEETKTAIWEWDILTGQVVWSSQAFTVMGYTTSAFEPTYESWTSRIYPEDREATEAAVRRAMTEQGEYSLQFRCVYPNRTVHWIEARGTFRYDPSGQCERMVGVMWDITKAKHHEEKLRRQQVRLKDLTLRLLHAQDNECRRISRELHDDHMQRLAALALNLHFLSTSLPRPVEEVKAAVIQQARTVEEMCTALRQLAHELHPALLAHVGFVASVTAHVREFEQNTGIKTAFHMVDDSLSIALFDEQALCFFRVVQESLQNVRKYAKARSVQIRLIRTPQGVGLCIHDDGVGFIVGEQSARGRSGLGLISLSERLEALGGTFRVRSKPDCGTEVHAWIPCELVKAQNQVGVRH